MDVVLDDRDVVGAGELGDGAASLRRQHAAGRVVDRRHAVEDLRAGAYEGLLERVHANALGVHGDAFEREVQEARERLHAGVGERLGQHAVAGLCERGEDREHRVLRAGADQHLLRRGLDAVARRPCRAGGAMAMRAGVRLIAQQVADVGPLAQAAKRAGEVGCETLDRTRSG